MKSVQDCQKLKSRIDALENSLDDFAMSGSVREVQTGSEKTAWTGGSESATRRRLAELKSQYENGQCAVVLGETPARRAVRRITPFAGQI